MWTALVAGVTAWNVLPQHGASFPQGSPHRLVEAARPGGPDSAALPAGRTSTDPALLHEGGEPRQQPRSFPWWLGLGTLWVLGLGALGWWVRRLRQRCTEQDRAQSALSANWNHVQRALQGGELGCWAMDLRANLIHLDGRACGLLGAPPCPDCKPLSWVWERVHGDDVTRLQEALTQHIRGSRSHISEEVRCVGGQNPWVRVHGRVVEQAPDGAPTTVAGTIEDVTTARQEAETRVQQMLHQRVERQALDQLGRVCGGLAREIENLLVPAGEHAAQALEQLAVDHRARSLVEAARVGVERTRELARQLLAFGGQRPLEMHPLDINDVVRSLVTTLRQATPDGILLETRLAPDLPNVHGDRALLEGVVMSLAAHARGAMPRGGRLVMETHALAKGCQETGGKPGLMVVVRDNGAGMDAPTLERLFEPRCEQPPSDKGLELAAAYGTIKQHGGSIHVDSTPGRGTTFRVYLPTQPQIPPPAKAHPKVPSAAPGNTVLLVEDEPMVRRVVHRILAQNGYQVLVAATPEEALTLVEAHQPSVHLLVTDAVLPGMSGLELHAALKPRFPRLRVLFISGYAPETQEGQERGAFLPKPFTPPDLLAKTRAMLEESRDHRDDPS